MTKKDYELIARGIAEARAYYGAEGKPHEHAPDQHTADAVARRVADELARDNSRFDRARFLAACGVTP